MKSYILLILSIFILTSFVLADPNINFVSPTPSNGSTVSQRNFIINATIDSSTPIDSIIYTANNTNYTVQNPTCALGLGFNNYSSIGENSTYVVDYCKGNNGTITIPSNVSWVSQGRYGGAYNFTGKATSMSFNTSLSISNYSYNNTISFWINPNKCNTDDVIISDDVSAGSKAYRIVFAGTSCSIAYSSINQSGSTVGTTLPGSAIGIGNWSFVTIIADKRGNQIYYYINGAMSNITTQNLVDVGTIRTTYIGSGRGTGNFLNATIDEVRIFNSSLNLNDIDNMYYSNLEYYNYTRFNYIRNQTNLSIYQTNFKLSANLTSGNYNFSNINLRYISNINLSSIILGTTRNDFYGYSGNLKTFGSDFTLTLNNGSTIYSNYTRERELFLYSLAKNWRQDIDLASFYTNTSVTQFNASGNFTAMSEKVSWFRNNNKTLTLIVDYMPSWLANKTDGYCNSTNNYRSCRAYNNSLYGDMAVDFYNRIGCTYDICSIEIWNEPDLASFWLNNISSRTNQTIVNEYINLASNITSKFRINDSRIDIYAPTLSNINTGTILRQVLGNISFDGTSFHTYTNTPTPYTMPQWLNPMLNSAFQNCSGDSCNNIRITELNIYNPSLENSTNRESEYKSQFSYMLDVLINSNYINNLSINIFKFTDNKNYSTNGDYPSNYVAWFEAGVNSANEEVRVPYYVFANSSRYSTGDIYNYTTDSNEISITTSKKYGYQNVKITNLVNDYQNITLNCGSFTGPLMDIQNGNLYSCATGSVNLGVIDAYDVRYYTEPIIDVVNGNYLYYNYLNELLFTESGASLIVNYTYVTAGGNAAGEIGNSLSNGATWVSILIITIFALVVLTFFTKIKPEGEASYY